MIALWLLLVVGLTVGGGMAGTRYIAASDTGTGESARADKRIHAADLEQPGVEQVLVRSGDRAATAAAAADLQRRLERLPVTRSVTGPRDTPALSTRGRPDRARPGRAARRPRGREGQGRAGRRARSPPSSGRTRASRPHEAGTGTINKAFDDIVADDLHRAELISLPITLVILVLAFGAHRRRVRPAPARA